MLERLTWRIVALGWLLLAVACAGDGGRDLARPEGSALWVATASPPVSAGTLVRLEGVGVDEVFLEVGELEAGKLTVMPRTGALGKLDRAAVTLVVGGRFPGPGIEAGPAAESLAAELGKLVEAARGAGLFPSGVHLDWRVDGDALEPMAELLGHLAPRLDPTLYLSATVDPDHLDHPDLEDLLAATDFVVVFVYGQRHPGAPRPQRWDLEAVVATADRLEASGEDYLLGVSTLGWLRHEDRTGKLLETTSRGRLGALANHPVLDPGHGFSLEGLDGQRYTFEASEPLRLEGLVVGAGDRLRVTRLAGVHLRRLRERLGNPALSHHLGQVYYRPPDPSEGLAMTLGALREGLLPEVPERRITARLEPADGNRLRVVVENPGHGPTELGRVDGNYVELTLARGSFRAVEPGEFARYDLLDGATGERTLARPDIARLYVPLLDPGQRVTSGTITLEGATAGDVGVDGRFLLPGGASAPVVAATTGPAEAP